MKNPLLQLHVSSKDFSNRRVINDISFNLNDGNIVSLVGPSGCGKSTLLRIISGLEKKYKGEVLINRKTPHLHSQDVGFIFQEPRLLPLLTVSENIGFDRGKKGGECSLVKELLVEVGLSDFANAYPKELSGGMAQRVAIARGLFTNPQLLLLDEPFSAVDAFTRMRLQDLLLSVAARHKTTILLVTHDAQEAAYLSDRVIILASRPGRIIGEVVIDDPRPKDRKDPSISQNQSQILKILNHQNNDYLNISDEIDFRNQKNLILSRYHFAI